MKNLNSNKFYIFMMLVNLFLTVNTYGMGSSEFIIDNEDLELEFTTEKVTYAVAIEIEYEVLGKIEVDFPRFKESNLLLVGKGKIYVSLGDYYEQKLEVVVRRKSEFTKGKILIVPKFYAL